MTTLRYKYLKSQLPVQGHGWLWVASGAPLAAGRSDFLPTCCDFLSADPAVGLSSLKVYGEPLLSHLSQSGRAIAAPIQECIHMLLRTAMREEVGAPSRLSLTSQTLFNQTVPERGNETEIIWCRNYYSMYYIHPHLFWYPKIKTRTTSWKNADVLVHFLRNSL